MTDVIRIPLISVYLMWFLISILMMWWAFWFIGTHWDAGKSEFRKKDGKPYKHKYFVEFMAPLTLACGIIGIAASLSLLGVYAFLWNGTISGISILFNYIFSGIPKVEFV